MTIKPLTNIPHDTLYEAFKLAFLDYEFQVGYDGFTTMLKRRGYNPCLSFGAFENDTIISFVLNGIGNYRGVPTAYDTGTGTVKEHRGKGLATAIMQHLIPCLKQAGIQQYILEVLQQNEKAVLLYEKLGFKAARELNYFFQQVNQIKIKNKNVSTIKQIRPNISADFSSFWDFEPSWQNSLDSIKRVGGGFICLGSFNDETLIGYCILQPMSGDITQLAVKKEYRRRGIASELLKKALSLITAEKIGVLNTDAACDSITAFLQNSNIPCSGKQFEMVLNL